MVEKVETPLEMDMLGSMRGDSEFQFRLLEWVDQWLFVQTLLSDFFNSPILGFGVEADFRSFVGEYARKVFLHRFHHSPMLYGLRGYCVGGNFSIPAIRIPSVSQFEARNTAPIVTYNEAFLALIVAYTCAPSFRHLVIDSFPHVSTRQQKINDLRISIQSIDQSQEFALVALTT